MATTAMTTAAMAAARVSTARVSTTRVTARMTAKAGADYHHVTAATVPAVPALSATPAETTAEGIAAPIIAGTMPAIVIPAVVAATEEELDVPHHLDRVVHNLYFLPPLENQFQERTLWSLSNAFTGAFKELEPIPQYKATAKLATFLAQY